jgi:hypothetical protein
MAISQFVCEILEYGNVKPVHTTNRAWKFARTFKRSNPVVLFIVALETLIDSGGQ